jgi:hypothetical protein
MNKENQQQVKVDESYNKRGYLFMKYKSPQFFIEHED